MGAKLSQPDFKKDLLSDKAVALVSEFALILYRRHGVLIDVDSNDVILLLFENAILYRDHRLRSIYLHIKTELCISISHSIASCGTVGCASKRAKYK